MSGFSLDCYNNSQDWWEWTDHANSTEFMDSVQIWHDNPSQNNGFYILPDDSGDYAFFYSREHFSSNRPKLVVTYTPPAPPDFIVSRLRPSPGPVNNTYYVRFATASGCPYGGPTINIVRLRLTYTVPPPPSPPQLASPVSATRHNSAIPTIWFEPRSADHLPIIANLHEI